MKTTTVTCDICEKECAEFMEIHIQARPKRNEKVIFLGTNYGGVCFDVCMDCLAKLGAKKTNEPEATTTIEDTLRELVREEIESERESR